MKETPSAFQDLLDFFEEIEQDTSLTPTRSVSSESDVNSLPSTADSAVISTPVSSHAVAAVPVTSAPTTPTPTSTTPVPTTASNHQVQHAPLATPTVDEDMDLEHIFDDVHQLLDQLLPQDFEVELPPQSPHKTQTATTTQQAIPASTSVAATGAANTPNPSYTAAQGTHAGVGNAAYDLPPTLTSWYEDDVAFTPSTINPTTNWEASADFPLSYADMIPDEQDFGENTTYSATLSTAATEATVTAPTTATSDTTTEPAAPASKAAKTTKKSRAKSSSSEQQAQADYYASLRALLRDSSELQPMGLSSKDQLTTLLEVLSQAKSPIDDHIDYHHLAAQDWEKIRATYTLNEAEIADLEAASSCGSFDYDGELNNKFQFIMANNEPLINQAFADELSSVAEEQLLLQAQQEHYSSSNKLLAQTTNVSAHGAYINISDSALSGKIVTTEQLEVPATQVTQVNEVTTEATSSQSTPNNKATKSKRKARSTTHLTPNGNSLTIHQIPVSAPGTPAPQSNPEVVWHVDLFRHEVNAPASSITVDTNQTASQSAPASTQATSNTANVVMHSVIEQPAKISQAQAAAFPDFNPFAEELFQENKFTSNSVATQNNQIEGIAELLGEKPVPEQARTPRTAAATSTRSSSFTNSYATTSANASGEQGIFDDLPLTEAELEQARKQQKRDTLQAASILSSLGFNIQTSPATTGNTTATEQATPTVNARATTVTGTSSSSSTATSATSKPSKKPTADKAQVLHDAEGHEFYSQYTYESDELDQSLELPVLASDAKLPSALLGTQSKIEKPTDVRPLENFGLCLRFEIDYRQYIDSFKSPENEPVITRVLQRLQLPMPACLLLTGEEGASLERKVTRALYDYIVQARKRNDGSYLSKATTFYMDLERLIHSNKPLSFFTSHPEEADIVIINNIQLCLNSDLWQARLVEIINYCMRNKRILVLTSALSKSELTEKLYGLNIMQDLNSRLQFFINLKFERLTGKYLTNYLQGRCVNQGTPLPSSTINYLANIIQVDRSVDIDMTAFRIFKFGVLRNFDTNKLSKYIIMKNEKAFIGRHLLTNKYVTDQELSIALFRRLDKLKYFDDRAGEYGDVWQELRQQYLAELDLNDDAVVTA